jgi:hypothetical protein
MFYSTTITIPAATAEAGPVIQRIKLSAGIIHMIDVEFRSGTDFTVGIRILLGGHQVYPTNPDGELKADGRAIIFGDYLPLEQGENELVIKGYAPSSTYEHTVYVKIGVLRENELNPSYSTDSLLMKFFRLVGIIK